MNSKQSTEIAEILTRIIPAIGKKIIKPMEQAKPGLSPLHINTLTCLAATDNHTMSTLSKAMGMSNQQTSAVVSMLEEKKYVLRKHSKTDRRVVNITITTLGKKALKESGDRYIKIISEQVKNIPESEYLELFETLKKLETILNRINSEVKAD